ncbi:MAG TPA: hypothetical protein VN843_02395, partial [Anaerolineales bacterium]|nr:hypothetical protein [Anaerolineales bacterium]
MIILLELVLVCTRRFEDRAGKIALEVMASSQDSLSERILPITATFRVRDLSGNGRAVAASNVSVACRREINSNVCLVQRGNPSHERFSLESTLILLFAFNTARWRAVAVSISSSARNNWTRHSQR